MSIAEGLKLIQEGYNEVLKRERFHVLNCIETQNRVDELEIQLENIRDQVIDECLKELSKYAFTSHSYSVLRKLRSKR